MGAIGAAAGVGFLVGAGMGDFAGPVVARLAESKALPISFLQRCWRTAERSRLEHDDFKLGRHARA